MLSENVIVASTADGTLGMLNDDTHARDGVNEIERG
jgi:hypothetical protein